jgi:hypothetical protein
MAYLNKATALSNVSNVSDAKVSLMQRSLGSILENLVSLISNRLELFIIFLDMY